jgi:hypothetical protein
MRPGWRPGWERRLTVKLAIFALALVVPVVLGASWALAVVIAGVVALAMQFVPGLKE